jgi:ribosome-binding factor A
MSNRTHRSGARSPRARGSTSNHGGPEADSTWRHPHRLEHILLEQLQSLIREAADPALEGVRLVSLRLSRDGGHARVPYAVEATPCDPAGVERASGQALERATGFLRSRLAGLLDLKRLPTLTFTLVGVQAPGAASDPSGGGDSWLA